jgi:Dolichyl-phosphate-mannose-protein mannosyltransferase
MMEEPSVLDYIKAKLMPWRGPIPRIPEKASSEVSESDQTGSAVFVAGGEPPVQESTPAEVAPASGLVTQTLPVEGVSVKASALPWVSLGSFAMAVIAQASLEPGPNRTWTLGAFLYLVSAVGVVVASWRGEWVPAALPEIEHRKDPLTVRYYGLIAGIPLAALAFFTFKDNQFTRLNVVLWILSLITILWAFWLPDAAGQSQIRRLYRIASEREWKLSITRGTLLGLAAIALVLFFRLYHLNQTPPEMFSDHAEKLLDVWDVLHGETRIFFPRNTGREALQMYMAAATILLFKTGYSHITLKIGTVAAGLLTLPFIYLLGKELGSKRIGLLALVFAGIAYWPNVISRVGLRFPLYPLFVAPSLYYLLRGIRTSNRNDYILSGLFLGIGLHGYTPIRILPIVIVVAVGLYLLHSQSRGVRKQTVWGLIVLAVIALMVFLPLLRYSLDNPEAFSYRSFSRLGSVERPLPGPAGEIFLKNLWKALTMFAWDDGEIWVVSVTHRPALDVISAALFYIGVVLLLVRYIRRRHWLDLFLLLSIPLLMLPSILSLAFPAENPALNRLSGVMVPVFLIVAIALDGLMTALQNRLSQSWGSKIAWGVALACVVLASFQNYALVFDEYQRVFELSSWNTSEMGQVIHSFTTSVGSPDTAYVVAFPHWVDTRLVGMNAGYPLKDYAIWPEQLAVTLADPRAKLFLVKPEDAQGLSTLQTLYPQGVLQEYTSRVENHNFYMFFVPPQQ